jgi:peptide/nickel transport system ATP-binding protein
MMADHAPPVLDVQGLSVAFQRGDRLLSAISDVSLLMCKGEILGLVGESGCGKSLTALAIMRLLPHAARMTHGRIVVAGNDVTAASESLMRQLRGSIVSMIFQDPMVALNPLMPVGRQIAESLLIHRDMSREQRRARVLELLEAVGIPDPVARYRQFPYELSGGMRQRVMIAIALACGPQLIIADEPTTALDVTIQAQILELLKDIRDRFRTAILFITHDMGVIADVADRVAVMYAGEIVETAAVERIFDRPAHPYTMGLLNSIPDLAGGETERLPSIPGRVPPLGSTAACPFQDRCPRVTDVCREIRPIPELVGDRHLAACWHVIPQEAEV